MKLYVHKSVLFPVFLLSISGSLLTAFSINDCIGRKSDDIDLLSDEKKNELKEIWFKDPAKNVGVGTVTGAVAGVMAQLLTRKGELKSATATGAFIGALCAVSYSRYKAWEQNQSIRADLDKNAPDGDKPSLSVAAITLKTDIIDTVSAEDGQESDEVVSPKDEAPQSTSEDVLDQSDFIQRFNEGFIQ